MTYFLDRLNAAVLSEDTYEVKLSNGKTITVVQYPEHNGAIWRWSVAGQLFDRDDWAVKYLTKIISEKLTGKRIVYHGREEVPVICGVDGAACRKPGKCNTAICSTCPVAEAFFAERDGVELIYAV